MLHGALDFEAGGVFARDADGLPLEAPMTYDQAELALWLGSSLRVHRDGRGLLWHVGLNDRVDYLEADGKRTWVFPDLYVVCGLRQRKGGPFKTWVLERAPDVIVEYAAADSVREDREDKRRTYDEIGVGEYFIFDVDQETIPGLLEGFAREQPSGPLVPLPRLATATGLARFHSARLGLDLGVALAALAPGGFALRAFAPGGAEPLPTAQEALAAQALREQEEAAAQALREQEESLLRDKDRELAALRDEIARLKRKASG